MPQNLLEELTRLDVPPPPVNINRQVHERLNQWLTTGQLVELVVQAFAYAAYHFASAVAGAVVYSLTGNFPTSRDAEAQRGNGTNE